MRGARLVGSWLVGWLVSWLGDFNAEEQRSRGAEVERGMILVSVFLVSGLSRKERKERKGDLGSGGGGRGATALPGDCGEGDGGRGATALPAIRRRTGRPLAVGVLGAFYGFRSFCTSTYAIICADGTFIISPLGGIS